MSARCRECKKGVLKIVGTGPYGDTIEVECQDCGEIYEVESDGLGDGGLEMIEAIQAEEDRQFINEARADAKEPMIVTAIPLGAGTGPIRGYYLHDGKHAAPIAMVIEAPGNGANHDEARANAAKFSCADLMYEACKMAIERLSVCDYHGDEDEYIQQLKEAIGPVERSLHV